MTRATHYHYAPHIPPCATRVSPGAYGRSLCVRATPFGAARRTPAHAGVSPNELRRGFGSGGFSAGAGEGGRQTASRLDQHRYRSRRVFGRQPSQGLGGLVILKSSRLELPLRAAQKFLRFDPYRHASLSQVAGDNRAAAPRGAI